MTFMVAVGAVLIAAGAATVWAWRSDHHKRQDRIGAIIALALVSLFMLNLIDIRQRFNDYVSVTEPRDAAQEKCAQDTLDTLRFWLDTRLSGVPADEALARVAREHPLPDCHIG